MPNGAEPDLLEYHAGFFPSELARQSDLFPNLGFSSSLGFVVNSGAVNLFYVVSEFQVKPAATDGA